MSFAMKLQEIRQNNELSQEKLAEILNVSRQSVSKWERGKGYPEIDKLIFISEHFNVSLDELLKGAKVKGAKNRKPIDLLKPNDKEIREVYPNGSGNAYTYEKTDYQTPFPTQPTQNITKYGNYTCTSSNASMSSNNTSVPFGKRRRKINTKLSLRRMSVLFALVAGGGCFTTAAIYRQINPVVVHDTVYVTAPNEMEAVEIFSEHYETRCLFDPDSKTYYIFDAEDQFRNGIVEQIHIDNLDEYISLIDIETGKSIYCYKQYADENPSFSCEGDDYKYIIPHQMIMYSIDAAETENYTIMTDVYTDEMCFIPNYILPEYRTEPVYEETVIYEDTSLVMLDKNGNIVVLDKDGNISAEYSIHDGEKTTYEKNGNIIISDGKGNIEIQDQDGNTLASYTAERKFVTAAQENDSQYDDAVWEEETPDNKTDENEGAYENGETDENIEADESEETVIGEALS